MIDFRKQANADILEMISFLGILYYHFFRKSQKRKVKQRREQNDIFI